MTTIMVDDIMTELHIICMIKENNRLCIRNGKLSIDVDSSGGGLLKIASWVVNTSKRWLRNDNRNNTLEHVSSLYQKAFKLYEDLEKDKEKNSWELSEFKRLFLESCNGLRNLSNTYSDDATVAARSSVLINKISNRN
jgi:hypothetical protein